MAGASKPLAEQAIYLGNLSACFARSSPISSGRCAGRFLHAKGVRFLLAARWLVAKPSPRTQPVKGAYGVATRWRKRHP